MKILVTGATGFIGSHIAQALQAAGFEVIGCVRNMALGQRLNPRIAHIACDFARDTHSSAWLPRLQGVDVVINAVGIITESGSNSFQAIHTETPKALFDACKLAGVKRIIQISALGVSTESVTAYNRTKMAADNYLMSLGVPAMVLRPSWLYGQRSRSFEVLCAFSALPLIPVTGAGDYQVQPIYIKDFAQGVAALVAQEKLDGQVIEAGGPERLAIKGMHALFRRWLGLVPAPFLHLPEGFVKRFVKLGDHLFKGPINTASFDMLTRHNTTNDTRLWQATGVKPRALANILSQHPSSVAQRQHAMLFFLLPLLGYSLAFLWIATAVVTGFLAPRSTALQLFAEAGLTGAAASWLFYGSLTVDFLLGLTLLFNYRLRRYGVAQAMLIAFYTLFLSLRAPEWWLHPYGPILKNIPLIAATLVVAATAKRT